MELGVENDEMEDGFEYALDKMEAGNEDALSSSETFCTIADVEIGFGRSRCKRGLDSCALKRF